MASYAERPSGGHAGTFQQLDFKLVQLSPGQLVVLFWCTGLPEGLSDPPSLVELQFLILPTGWAFTSLMRKFNHEAN